MITLGVGNLVMFYVLSHFIEFDPIEHEIKLFLSISSVIIILPAPKCPLLASTPCDAMPPPSSIL